MTQKGVEEELKRRLEAKELAEYQGHLECLQTTPGYPRATAHISNPLQKTMEELEKELNQDFSSSDKVNQKKKIRKNNNYSPTKVKARNLLTNVSYNRIKNSDFENKSFVIDCYSFILLYLNPFYLERKFENIEIMLMQCGIYIYQMIFIIISLAEHFETLN